MIIYYSTEFSGGRPESRRLLEKAFARQLGDPALAGDLIKRIKTGEQGKPYIDGFSFFSVSHTGSLWAVLIDERECGLDIQLGRNCNMQAIADRVYASGDRAALGAAAATGAEDEEYDLFFRIWTRREAFAKALGESAVKSDLPAVLPDRVEFTGQGGKVSAYLISDIPAEEAVFSASDRPEEKLYAAVCMEDDGSQIPEPVFVRI